MGSPPRVVRGRIIAPWLPSLAQPAPPLYPASGAPFASTRFSTVHAFSGAAPNGISSTTFAASIGASPPRPRPLRSLLAAAAQPAKGIMAAQESAALGVSPSAPYQAQLSPSAGSPARGPLPSRETPAAAASGRSTQPSPSVSALEGTSALVASTLTGPAGLHSR